MAPVRQDPMVPVKCGNMVKIVPNFEKTLWEHRAVGTKGCGNIGLWEHRAVGI